MLQVLVALRFVATGSFYNLVGESLGVAKSTTGRAARHGCHILAGKAGNYIKFPRDVSSYKSRFFEKAGKLSLLLLTFVLFRRPDFMVIGAKRPASVMFTYILSQTIVTHTEESCATFSASISVKVGISVEQYFVNNYIKNQENSSTGYAEVLYRFR